MYIILYSSLKSMQFSKRLGLLDVCDVCSFASLEFADVDNLVLDGVFDEIAGFMKVLSFDNLFCLF